MKNLKIKCVTVKMKQTVVKMLLISYLQTFHRNATVTLQKLTILIYRKLTPPYRNARALRHRNAHALRYTPANALIFNRLKIRALRLRYSKNSLNELMDSILSGLPFQKIVTH
jgi:hypothetical protein